MSQASRFLPSPDLKHLHQQLKALEAEKVLLQSQIQRRSNEQIAVEKDLSTYRIATFKIEALSERTESQIATAIT